MHAWKFKARSSLMPLALNLKTCFIYVIPLKRGLCTSRRCWIFFNERETHVLENQRVNQVQLLAWALTINRRFIIYMSLWQSLFAYPNCHHSLLFSNRIPILFNITMVLLKDYISPASLAIRYIQVTKYWPKKCKRIYVWLSLKE